MSQTEYDYVPRGDPLTSAEVAQVRIETLRRALARINDKAEKESNED